MNIRGKEDLLMVLMAVLWLGIMIMGWLNQYLIGMILSVVLMMIHMILGVSKNGKLSKKFWLYPLLCWAVLWIASFSLSEYFAKHFAGQMPSFTVGGFHPSFAPTFFLYYIGGMLTLTVGYVIFQDEWLTDEDWNNFLEKVKKNKEV